MAEEKAALLRLLSDVSKSLKALSDSLYSISDSINVYVQALGSAEGWRTVQISRNGSSYGQMVLKPNEVVAVPAGRLGIRVNDAAVQRFLISKVLEPMKQKYGCEYTVEADGEALAAIRVKGQLDQEHVERLRKAIAWAFEKASARKTSGKGEVHGTA